MPLSPEASVGRVLSALGTSSDALLGAGGQASVYALGDDRVVRVLRPGGDAEAIRRRQELVDSLGRDRVPFALPDVLEVREIEGLIAAIERRLPGRSVLDELRHRDGKGRARVIEAHLVAAARLGDLHVHAREWFGDLIAEDAVRAASWREYLSERVARNLTRGPSELRSIDPAAIADDMPDIGEASFVHLDAFGGNMLMVGDEVTAVLDIGETSIGGDRRLDPVSAAVYLSSPEISGDVTERDLDVVKSWLRAAELADLFVPVRRWLAGYWSFAADDLPLAQWCRSVLLERPARG